MTPRVELAVAMLVIADRYDLRVLRTLCMRWLACDAHFASFVRIVARVTAVGGDASCQQGRARREGESSGGERHRRDLNEFKYWRGLRDELLCERRHGSLINQVGRTFYL